MAIDPTTGLDTGTGSGGLLGSALSNPAFNFGVGLLSRTGPSLTPQSGLANIGGALQYASQAQQEAQQNELIRAKLAENARQQAAATKLEELVKGGGLGTLPQGMTRETAAAILAADPTAASKFIPSVMDPQTLATIMQTQAQIAKINQDLQATKGGAVSESVGTVGDIMNIASASERLDKAGSIFAPGGLVDKFGGLDTAAAALQTAVQYPGAAKGFGIEPDQAKEWLRQVTDGQTVSKATAALAQSLQGATGSSSRSAYALRNIQTALGQNMLWSAKRRILIHNLDTLFADVKEQGTADKVPQFEDAKRLYDELKKQDEAFTKGESGKTVAPTDTASAAAPPDLGAGPGAAPPQGPGAGALPATFGGMFGSSPASAAGMSFVTPTTSVPVVPQKAAPAAASTPQPAIRGVKTSEFGTLPDGSTVPKYRDPAVAAKAYPDLKRKGIKQVIIVDPKTGIEYLYGEGK